MANKASKYARVSVLIQGPDGTRNVSIRINPDSVLLSLPRQRQTGILEGYIDAISDVMVEYGHIELLDLAGAPSRANITGARRCVCGGYARPGEDCYGCGNFRPHLPDKDREDKQDL